MILSAFRMIAFALAVVAATAATPSDKRGVSFREQTPYFEMIACLAEGGWYYNWSMNPTPTDYALEFVPMVFGRGTLGEVDLRSRYPALLMFNEPNRGSGRGIQAAPEELVEVTAQLDAVTDSLISPAPTPKDTFRPWFREYMAEASDELEAIAIHWFGNADFGEFRDFIERVKSTYGKPIWITAFAPADRNGEHTEAQIVAFLAQAIPYLEGEPMVERYAWFGLEGRRPSFYEETKFLDSEGRLSPVGDEYLLGPLATAERELRLQRCNVELAVTEP